MRASTNPTTSVSQSKSRMVKRKRTWLPTPFFGKPFFNFLNVGISLCLVRRLHKVHVVYVKRRVYYLCLPQIGFELLQPSIMFELGRRKPPSKYRSEECHDQQH